MVIYNYTKLRTPAFGEMLHIMMGKTINYAEILM